MPESLTIQGWLPWQDLDASQPRSLSGAVRLVSASGQGSANRSLTLLVSARSATGSHLRGGQLLTGLNLSGAAQAAGLGISASGSGASASWTIRQANAPDGAARLATLSSTADAQVEAISGGSQVSLAFNQQQVLLPSVAPASLTPQVLAIWQG